jgi:predicted nucleic acid-binding protein
VILLDTSGLLAALDGSQAQHRSAAEVLRTAEGPLLLSPFVLAELDYLLATRVSLQAEVALLDEVSRGAYRLESFLGDDVAAARGIIERYADLSPGLADASIVVLADRHDVSEVLTLDERHFRTLRDSRGRPFRLLPADATGS